MTLTTRRRNVISGLCALVLLVGVTTIGVKWSFGEFDDGYRIRADFAAAGQGLIEGSDVKVRGLDVGHVEAIELRDGRALVTLFIDDGHAIPSRSSSFTIRPKTLFGEKFVDVVPGPEETTGPYLAEGDEVPRFFDEGAPMPDEVLRDREGRALRSAGGFELEQVLADAYPILQAIDPQDVRIVLERAVPSKALHQEPQRCSRDRSPNITAGIHDGGHAAGEIAADIQWNSPGDSDGHLQAEKGKTTVPDAGERIFCQRGGYDPGGGDEKPSYGDGAAGKYNVPATLIEVVG
jgi:hypothetical protein